MFIGSYIPCGLKKMHFSAYIMLHMIPKRCMLALVAVVSFAGMGQSQELRKVSNEEATERLTKRVPPQYPPLALTAHIQGSVAIEITITETGSVENMRTLSGHPILVQSAMDAVKQWEFDPFKEDGKPVAVLASIKVDFQLGPGAEFAANICSRKWSAQSRSRATSLPRLKPRATRPWNRRKAAQEF